MTAGYELLDHTADVVVRAWGASAEQVFEQAALATVSLLYDGGTVRPRQHIAVEVSAPDAELLLAAWLNELLFLIEARGLVFARFKVESLCPGGEAGAVGAAPAASAAPEVRLRATAVGEAFDGRRHTVRSVVKAATLHDLSLRAVPGGWEGRVLLDV